MWPAHATTALDMWEEMRSSGISPDASACTALLVCFRGSRALVRQGMHIFESELPLKSMSRSQASAVMQTAIANFEAVGLESQADALYARAVETHILSHWHQQVLLHMV